jgi:hypothetical protein
LSPKSGEDLTPVRMSRCPPRKAAQPISKGARNSRWSLIRRAARLHPIRNRHWTRQWIPRDAVAAFRGAKADLAVALADTSSLRPENQQSRLSHLQYQVAILRPAAIVATDRYWALAQEASRGTSAEIEQADRLRGQARETMRSAAQDADKARFAAKDAAEWAYAKGSNNLVQVLQEYKAAAEFSVVQWEKASTDAAMRGDAREFEQCKRGVEDAVREFENALKMCKDWRAD